MLSLDLWLREDGDPCGFRKPRNPIPCPFPLCRTYIGTREGGVDARLGGAVDSRMRRSEKDQARGRVSTRAEVDAMALLVMI